MDGIDDRPRRARTGPRAAAALIASRNFGPYFVGNALSSSGTWFQTLAGALLVYRLTHSAFLLGVLAFGQFVPMLVLAPWAGSVADRFDRQRVVVLAQLSAVGLSAALAGVAWAGGATAAVVIVVGIALGVAAAFTLPASQALVVSLVDEEELSSAIALNSMTYNVARALGPALA